MNTSKTRGYLASLLSWLLVFVVIPNLVCWGFGRFFFLDRELINPDYAVLGTAWPWLPAWLRVTAFAIIFLVDAVTSTGSMYNISPVAGVVALLRAPIGLLITVILAFAGICALAAGLGKLADRFAWAPRALVFTTSCLLLTLASILLAPARSGIGHLAGDIVERDRGYRTAPSSMRAATDALRRDVAAQETNVAVVVVESWGVLADRAAHDALVRVFRTPELQRRYQIEAGEITFRGGTTSGELRELCGVFTDYLVLNDGLLA